MENTVTIEFTHDADMHRFVSLYRGTGGFFGHSYENYDGPVHPDRVLGSGTPLVHLDRRHVKDFRRLGLDVKNCNGNIRF